MAKNSPHGAGGGLKLLASIGGIALLMLAVRVIVPMYPEATSLLSFAAVVLGALAGPREGFIIGLLYAAAVIVGLPAFIADGHIAPENPFASKASGLLIGVACAAATSGKLSQGNFARVLGAMLAGHAVFLVLGALWLMHFDPWKHALYAGIVPYLVPACAKSLGAAVTVVVVRKFV